MRRTRVLHLITHLGFGGAQDNTLLTVERHDRRRFEVDLAAGPDYGEWLERGRRVADSFSIIPGLTRALSPAADARTVGALRDHIRAGQYDIVHTHSSKAGVLGRVAAWRAGVRCVVHTYHSFSWQVTGPPANGRDDPVGAVTKWGYVQLERGLARISHALITVCELNRVEAQRLGIAGPGKFKTIYSGIDLDRYVASRPRAEVCRALGLDDGRPIVGSIGRLADQKAPLDLVAAARRVLERRPDAQFVLVGDGPLAEQVRAAVADEPRIRLIGYRDDVPDMLTAFDVFMQASLWEGLGRAATEAMIMCLPVAATAVDGVPELVEDGRTGMLSPPGDPQSLADSVVWLLDHPHEARAMGLAGNRRVVPAFDVSRMLAAIETTYDELLAGTRLTRPVGSLAAREHV